jgi:UDP-N-acetylmuramoyl-L-alanyl-D-glutamate-L-lysine ligase
VQEPAGKNADKVIINREIPYFELLAQKTRAFGNQLITYGSDQSDADYRFTLGEHGHFQVASFNDQLPTVAGDFRVMLPGSFNCSNATAALAVAAQLSDKTSEFAAGLLETKVPGRMEILKNEKGYVACVDYAHNYLSMSESFKFLKHEYPDGRLIVVTGSVGSKAESRRQDIGRALSEYADVAILTEDDNYFEDPKKIIQAIRDHIVDPHVEVHEILNREEAIKTAFQMARPGDVMFMAAKGREQFLRENGHDKPYVGDYQLTEQLMKAYN